MQDSFSKFAQKPSHKRVRNEANPRKKNLLFFVYYIEINLCFCSGISNENVVNCEVDEGSTYDWRATIANNCGTPDDAFKSVRVLLFNHLGRPCSNVSAQTDKEEYCDQKGVEIE